MLAGGGTGGAPGIVNGDCANDCDVAAANRTKAPATRQYRFNPDMIRFSNEIEAISSRPAVP
jgi:hypothetical protein